MMRRSGILLSAVGVGGLWLCSCGKSVEPPPRGAMVEGKGAAAAVAPTEPDRGILQDPAQYQPAAFTPPPSKAKEAAEPGGPSKGTDEAGAAAARKFAVEMMDAMLSNRFDRVMERIDPEQTALLRAESATLLKAQEELESARALFKEKLGAEAMDQLAATARGAVVDSLQIEVTSAEAATITPNPLQGVFGPELAGPTGKLVLVDGAWRFKLDAPLTSEDVAKVLEMYKNMQSMMNIAKMALEQGQVDPEMLKAQMSQMVGAIQLPAGSQPSSGPAAGEKPKAGKGERPAP